jgi:hypothetical protein
MGAFDFVGTVLSGWLADRYDNRSLLFWCYGHRCLGPLMLPHTDFSRVYGKGVKAGAIIPQ